MNQFEPGLGGCEKGPSTAELECLPQQESGRQTNGDVTSARQPPREPPWTTDEATSRKKRRRIGGGDGVEGGVVPRVCERCSAIPWRAMGRGLRCNKVVINESIYVLQQSQCRICRLLGYFLLQNTATAPSYQVTLPTSSHDFPGPHLIRRWNIASRPGYLWYRSTKAQILVTEADPYNLSNDIHHFHPRTLNIDRIKAWIGDCQSRHADRCSLHPPNNLKDLKVIDCDREEVVSAPIQCQYIALSYVWGVVDSCPTIITPNTLRYLPRTIIDAIKITRDLGCRYLWVDRYVSQPWAI